MRIVTIVGARPQFIKAAVLSRHFAARTEWEEILVHTGQHYDANLSAVFFEELAILEPTYNLRIGSGPHGQQTGRMLEAIEEILIDVRPDWVLVYGDTNSTLAGALAASKLHLRVAHVEAGLRSFNRRMPEEINRVLTDHISDLLLCPSDTAVDNLTREGLTKNVYQVGDVMADALAFAVRHARLRSNILDRLQLAPEDYLLATVHRAENTNSRDRLESIFAAFKAIGETIVFPMHPRTLKSMHAYGIKEPANVLRLEPIGYLDMVVLESEARAILTDSGGVQKEAYWLSIPCITLRDETEWVETVNTGWNVLTGPDTVRILSAVREMRIPSDHPTLYGDGRAGIKCLHYLTRNKGESA